MRTAAYAIPHQQKIVPLVLGYIVIYGNKTIVNFEIHVGKYLRIQAIKSPQRAT